jgi:hypothetical protein
VRQQLADEERVAGGLRLEGADQFSALALGMLDRRVDERRDRALVQGAVAPSTVGRDCARRLRSAG